MCPERASTKSWTSFESNARAVHMIPTRSTVSAEPMPILLCLALQPTSRTLQSFGKCCLLIMDNHNNKMQRLRYLSLKGQHYMYTLWLSSTRHHFNFLNFSQGFHRREDCNLWTNMTLTLIISFLGKNSNLTNRGHVNCAVNWATR